MSHGHSRDSKTNNFHHTPWHDKKGGKAEERRKSITQAVVQAMLVHENLLGGMEELPLREVGVHITHDRHPELCLVSGLLLVWMEPNLSEDRVFVREDVPVGGHLPSACGRPDEFRMT